MKQKLYCIEFSVPRYTFIFALFTSASLLSQAPSMILQILLFINIFRSFNFHNIKILRHFQKLFWYMYVSNQFIQLFRRTVEMSLSCCGFPLEADLLREFWSRAWFQISSASKLSQQTVKCVYMWEMKWYIEMTVIVYMYVSKHTRELKLQNTLSLRFVRINRAHFRYATGFNFNIF